jgi:hypothetical protein
MCGAAKTHPGRPGQANTYYVCQYDPANSRHVAAAPDHPRTISAREDILQREAIEAELAALASDTGRADDIDLPDELPELAGRLDEVPEHLQAELFAVFDIQVVWNQPMNQVTFFAAPLR